MFSIIFPMDTNRLEQFKNTKRVYDEMPEQKEFIILTRNEFEVACYLDDNNLTKDVILIPYEVKEGFNPSKAFNVGIRNSHYKHIIITSPEVKPTPYVLAQLAAQGDKNVICRVFDEAENGVLSSLVHKGYRDETPAMYFLAMFNKSDIKKLNGWDEEFMKGYAYEDNDFGARWVRAGLPWETNENITAVHQFHPRSETIQNGSTINLRRYEDNNNEKLIRPVNGLVNLDI